MTDPAVSLDYRGPEGALLSTLAYSDIFDQPLTLAELRRYFPYAISSEQLCRLVEESGPRVEQVGGFFMLPGRGAILQTRMRREAASRRLWRRAWPWMHAVAALPFVRMLAVTGSLATQSSDEGDDIDLFVVTAPGALWVCRAMILLVARFARLRGLRLCPNYLVSERALELPARSLYVARELAQMVPLSGAAVYDRMRALNHWTGDYLPNAADSPASSMRLIALPLFRWGQRILEAILRPTPLRIVESYEMRRKIPRLQREQGLSPEAYFSADVCKGHIDRHGLRIEARLMRRLADLESMEAGTAVVIEIEN